MRIGSVVGWSYAVVDPTSRTLDTRVYTSTTCRREESFLLNPEREDKLLVLDKFFKRDPIGGNITLVKVLDARGRMFWKQIWAFRSLEGGEP